MLTIFFRAVILFAAAVIAVRVMGKRQVGQLQPFELVVMIMIAEMAATPIESVDESLLSGILPMAALVVCHGLLSTASMVSQRLRVILCGSPTVLIRHGVICEKQLRRASMTLHDLMEMLRVGGIQDPADVDTAVLETGGSISVFPKAAVRPVTPADLNIDVVPEGLPLPLIIDGHIQADNMTRGSMDAGWLATQLRALGYGEVSDVFFLCLSPSGRLICQGKGRTEMQQLQTDKQGSW